MMNMNTMATGKTGIIHALDSGSAHAYLLWSGGGQIGNNEYHSLAGLVLFEGVLVIKRGKYECIQLYVAIVSLAASVDFKSLNGHQ